MNNSPSIPDAPLTLADLIYSSHFGCGKCEKCGCNGAIKCVSLKPKSILIFSLSRYSSHAGGAAKVTTTVEYPLSFSVALSEDTFSEYHLIGVIVHHGGSLKEGHYTAYVRLDIGTQTFYHCNDSQIVRANLEDVQNNPDAYLLWYRKAPASSQSLPQNVPLFTFGTVPFTEQLTEIQDPNDALMQLLEDQHGRILNDYANALGVAEQKPPTIPSQSSTQSQNTSLVSTSPSSKDVVHPPKKHNKDEKHDTVPSSPAVSGRTKRFHLSLPHNHKTQAWSRQAQAKRLFIHLGSTIKMKSMTQFHHHQLYLAMPLNRKRFHLSLPPNHKTSLVSTSPSSKVVIHPPKKHNKDEKHDTVPSSPAVSGSATERKKKNTIAQKLKQNVLPSPLRRFRAAENHLSNEAGQCPYQKAVDGYKSIFTSSPAYDESDLTILIDLGAACSIRSNPRFFGTVAFAANDVLMKERNAKTSQSFGYLSRYDVISFIKLLGYISCSKTNRHNLSLHLAGHRSFDDLINASLTVWNDYHIESRIELFGIPTLLALPGLILFPYTADVFKTIPDDLIPALEPLFSSPLSLLLLTLDIITGSPIPPYSCDRKYFCLSIPNHDSPSSWSLPSSCRLFFNLFLTLSGRSQSLSFVNPHVVLPAVNTALHILSSPPETLFSSHRNLHAELLVGVSKLTASSELATLTSSFTNETEQTIKEYIQVFLSAIGQCTPRKWPDIPKGLNSLLQSLTSTNINPASYSLSDFGWTDPVPETLKTQELIRNQIQRQFFLFILALHLKQPEQILLSFMDTLRTLTLPQLQDYIDNEPQRTAFFKSFLPSP